MIGIKTHCYATGPQDDRAGQKEVEGGHAVKLLKMWEITPLHNAEIRQDYHPDTRDACEDIPLDQGPHEVTGESYLLGAGTQGAAPDLDNVYSTAFEKKAAGATTRMVRGCMSQSRTRRARDGPVKLLSLSLSSDIGSQQLL